MSKDARSDRESAVRLKTEATWGKHLTAGVACALLTSAPWVVSIVASPNQLPFLLAMVAPVVVAIALVGAVAAVPCRLVLVATARRARNPAPPVAWTAVTAGVIAFVCAASAGAILDWRAWGSVDPAVFFGAAQVGIIAAATAAVAARLSLTRGPFTRYV